MSEPYVIKMPQLSDTMTEGVIVSWEKNIGDEIRRGDIVATVETDKAIMDVEVFRDGFLSGPIAPVDAVVPVTHPIGYIVDTKEEVVEGTGEPTAKSAATHDRPPPCARHYRPLRRRPLPPRANRFRPRQRTPRPYRARRASSPRRWRANSPASGMSTSTA